MNPQTLLACALDPSHLFKVQGLAADPWQQQFLLSTPRFSLLNCSRQVGKSTTVGALALHTALFHPNSLVLLLSPSLRQSNEIFRKVLEGYSHFKGFLGANHQTRAQLELMNGSRILSLPGKEQFIRSFGGVSLLVLDEAARIPDELYRSVRPMLAVSGGKLAALSTPYGKRGWFHDAWTGTEDWHRIAIPWHSCPRIPKEFIEQEIQAMGPDWVDQEYLCIFSNKEGQVFANFESTFINEIQGKPASHVGGIDFGWHNPFAALWGFVDEQHTLVITHEHYVTHATISEIAPLLPRNVTWWADPANPGDIASLNKLGLVVRKGENALRTGIAAVSSRINTGKLKVIAARCPNLIREARGYRYPESGGEIPIDADNHALAALRYLIASLDRNGAATSSSKLFASPKKPETWRRIH